MTDRIQRLQAHIEQLNAAGARRSLFYPLAHQALEHLKDEPLQIRRAKAQAYLLDHAPVCVLPGELIVGSMAQFCPVDEGGAARIGDEVRQAVDDLPWSAASHLSLCYERALTLGLRGIEAEAKAGLRAAKDEEAEAFYTAARIGVQAAQRFILRYANAVSGEANRTPGLRGEELKHMALALRHIATEPAESFYEGLQLTWLLHIMMNVLGGSSLSLGRLDQYLGARYKADLRSGAITQEEAHELLSCLFLKLNEPMLGTTRNLTLGGATKDGNDAVNSLTLLCLDVAAELGLPYPSIGARMNRVNPSAYRKVVLDASYAGAGQPLLLNDDVWAESLAQLGYRLGDANDYGTCGIEVLVPGKTAGRAVVLQMVFPALISSVFQKRREGELVIESYDQFFEGYKREIWQAVQRGYAEAQARIRGMVGRCYDPFASLFVEGCLANGRDLYQGGSALGVHWSFEAYGLATAADALMAVAKWVFDRRWLTIDQLDRALLGNYMGREQLRQMLSITPHYGNDNDAVDGIARSVLSCFTEAVFELNQKGARDKFVSTLPEGVGVNADAMPNGRRCDESFSSGMNPSWGTDENGPTAMLNSVVKLDFEKMTGGCALHLNLNPEQLAGRRELADALIMGYLDGGGPEVQVAIGER